MSDRKVCGNDNATDFYIERTLKISEIENLAKDLQGRLSAFGNLFYIDFEFSRLTISSNSLRCTLRTKIDSHEDEDKLILYLKQMDENKNIKVVN